MAAVAAMLSILVARSKVLVSIARSEISSSCAGAFRDAGGQPLVVDGAYIRQWIHMRYKACNFKRYMSESDMSVSPSRSPTELIL